MPGQFKGVADHPLAAVAGEDTGLQHHFPVCAGEEVVAGPGVFPFAVFPHHNHVDVLPLHIFQRAGSAFQKLHRAQVHILVKALADLEQQIPQGHMIGHTGSAHRPQVDGVKVFQLLHAVFWHHPAGFQIVFAAPGERCDLKRKGAVCFFNVPQHPQAFFHHFRADAVAADGGNAIGFHRASLL